MQKLVNVHVLVGLRHSTRKRPMHERRDPRWRHRLASGSRGAYSYSPNEVVDLNDLALAA